MMTETLCLLNRKKPQQQPVTSPTTITGQVLQSTNTKYKNKYKMTLKSSGYKSKLYQQERKAKVSIKKGSVNDPKHKSSLVKACSVTACALMAASETGTLIVIDNGSHDGSSRMNSEFYRAIRFP